MSAAATGTRAAAGASPSSGYDRMDRLEAVHDWDGLADALGKAIASEHDVTAKAALHLRLGRIQEDKLGQVVPALQSFQDAYKLDPKLGGALRQARAIYWMLAKTNMVKKLLDLENPAAPRRRRAVRRARRRARRRRRRQGSRRGVRACPRHLGRAERGGARRPGRRGGRGERVAHAHRGPHRPGEGRGLARGEGAALRAGRAHRQAVLARRPRVSARVRVPGRPERRAGRRALRAAPRGEGPAGGHPGDAAARARAAPGRGPGPGRVPLRRALGRASPGPGAQRGALRDRAPERPAPGGRVRVPARHVGHQAARLAERRRARRDAGRRARRVALLAGPGRRRALAQPGQRRAGAHLVREARGHRAQSPEPPGLRGRDRREARRPRAAGRAGRRAGRRPHPREGRFSGRPPPEPERSEERPVLRWPGETASSSTGRPSSAAPSSCSPRWTRTAAAPPSASRPPRRTCDWS